MTPLVKICGTTTPADSHLAVQTGADFVGVVLHPPSPRFIGPEQVREIRAAANGTDLVLVTVNLPLEMLLDYWAKFQPYALQLHGDESPALVRELVEAGARVWKVLSGPSAQLPVRAELYTSTGAEALLVDAREVTEQGVVYGGTGHIADWNAARHLVDEGHRVMLAGGLTPENVGRAIEVVQPWALDVVTGVEARKGIKDPEKVRQFVQLAKQLSVPTPG